MNSLIIAIVGLAVLLVVVFLLSVLVSKYEKYLKNKYKSLGTIVGRKLENSYSDEGKNISKHLKLTNKF